MGAFPRVRALLAASAIAGAVVGATTLAASATAHLVVRQGELSTPSSPVVLPGSTTDRIVGGTEVQDGEWEGSQFLVKLFRRVARPDGSPGLKFNCGGSLYRPNKVITAAHCSVRVGDLVQVGGLTFQQGFSSNIESITRHPDWDPATNRADLMVLTLANPRTTALLSTINVRKTGINKDPAKPTVGDSLVIAGWGLTSGSSTSQTSRLRQANIKIMDFDECAAIGVARRAPLPEGFGEVVLCAAAAGVSTCEGDSGGPLFFRSFSPTGRPITKLAGISSFVLSDKDDAATGTVAKSCPPGTLNYFTRVSTFASWIDAQMDPGWRGWESAP